MAPAILHGTVVGDYGQYCDVLTTDGAMLRCTVRRRAGEVVCGDAVGVEPTNAGAGIIIERAPRTSLLQRPDSRSRLKSIAANVDQMVIVIPPRIDADANELLDLFALDRYVAAGECAHVTPCIVINKCDLVPAAATAALQRIVDVYAALGYPVIRTSCREGIGIEILREQLRNRTNVLVGPSGAGKSSLVGTLLPGVDARVGEVSASSGQGRHTTTWTRVYALPSGGNLMDSPGIREFGLWQTAPREVAAGFREFHTLPERCRFLDCAHLTEPGCAVRAAAHSGVIAAWRYDHFRRLTRTG